MHDLLLWNHATVTTCHSKTVDLPEQVTAHRHAPFTPQTRLLQTRLPHNHAPFTSQPRLLHPTATPP